VIDQVINRIVAGPPAAGHRISFVRLTGGSSMDLVDLYEAAGRLAVRLAGLGLGPGDRIGILAGNGPEWVLLDLAALRLKAVTAGFEPGKFEAGDELVARYGLKLLFTDRPIVATDAASGTDGAPRAAAIHSIAEVATLSGREGFDDGENGIPAAVYGPGDVTTIKFTSGSTGEPKGLDATVGSIDSSISAVQELFEHGRDDDLFLFLPLSLLQQRYWVYSALCYGHDVTVSTYEAAFVALGRARPTVVMGVPAFFESAMKHIEARARRASADGVDQADAMRGAARELFGDRIRYLWTGSAPARPTMLRCLADAGMPIYEGYGLNETCIVAKNHPGAHREGSVGQVLARKKVLFDQDGVISVYSEYPVNSGYAYAAPGDSERVFGADGVVRTGDVGYLDEDGFLFIRGRADDVIVLDNGRKVIVRPIEERMRSSPAIAECVVYCPDQTRLVAVVSPAAEPADEAAITAHLARANAAAARDEQISLLIIARPAFGIGNGLLTSQYKPRRKQIFEAYRAEIEAGRPAAPARQAAHGDPEGGTA
jgi:long-subunit acyl-CoA synthetase (AMP-forming)